MVIVMCKILRTEKADSQIREIIQFIEANSESSDAALIFLEKMEKTIKRLKNFPESGSIPRYPTLRKQGYRVLIVEKHLIFYKYNKESATVMIYAVVDSRREYQFLI